jgi:hypothetical protein
VESPCMAEVGAPVILSLGVAGYCSVLRTSRSAFVAGPDGASRAVDFRV